MELSPEQKSFLTLHLVPGLGPRLTAALLERFGSAAAVLKARPEELCEVPHIGAKLARDLHQSMRSADLAQELALMERFQANLLVLGSPEYPPPLANIPDPPHVLYVRGTWQPSDTKAVALVGSRNCTSYGIRTAERLARDLAHAGYTITSGLARGIDAAAHRGALKAGGRTLAVLAGGLSRIYPPEHQDLALEVQAAGALISEASMAMEPLAALFPNRNRLISGLSLGVVVVEAAEKSGALITASRAGDQGRTVFAVPGPVDSAASGGTNDLIRKGAILIRSADDVREELEGVQAGATPVPAEPPPALDGVELRVWQLLAEKPRHIDELTRDLGLAIPEVARTLMVLEMKKLVRRLPGNIYERR
jgi:DNA processing protein